MDRRLHRSCSALREPHEGRFAWEAHVKEMPHNDITIEGYYTPEVKAKGITYDIELEEGFAIVSSYDSELVKDTLWIPESVSFQGKSYPVYRIADKVFMDNSTLTTAILSMSVMWIGNDAFRNCRSLADVYVFNVAKPHLVGNPFMDSSYDQGAVLHVPARSVSNYSTAGLGFFHAVIISFLQFVQIHHAIFFYSCF